MTQISLETFKLSEPVEGSKKFFNNNPASEWSFKTYLRDTHLGLSKETIKNVSYIYHSYRSDLDWLSSLKHLPELIGKHIADLRKNQKYTRSERAQLFCPGERQRIPKHQPICVTNNISGSSTQNNYYYTSLHKGSKRRRQQYSDSDSSSEGEDPEEAASSSIWDDWTVFLKQSASEEKFHKYSPEMSKVIRCGKGVSPRPNLPHDTYVEHLDQHSERSYPLPVACTRYIDSVIDSREHKAMKRAIKRIPIIDDNDYLEETLDFLNQLFSAADRMYSASQNMYASETVFNFWLVHPFMSTVASANKDICKSKCDFIPGETELKAMSKQLKAVDAQKDDRYHYNADGIIRLCGLGNLEIAILETSGELGNHDKVKINFDHHKGMFGALAMLKTLGDTYPYTGFCI